MASRILVVRFGALGDLVLLTVLLRALRQRFPEARLDVATKGRYSTLLTTHPAVDRIYSLPPDGRLSEFAAGLREEHHDVLIDAHDNLRSRRLRSLLHGRWHTLTKPRFQRFLATWSPSADEVPHLTEQYRRTVSSLGVVLDEDPPDLYPSDADTVAARRIADGRYVVLAPGAAHRTKRWPAVHWQRLAEIIRASGYETVGLGLTRDAAALPHGLVRCAFGFPIGVGVALCRRALAVVANDSGIMHVATAVNTPVVGLYGPTAPNLGYAPYTRLARTAFVDLPCRPCSVFGGPWCPAGHHRCMTELGPDSVHRALTELL